MKKRISILLIIFIAASAFIVSDKNFFSTPLAFKIPKGWPKPPTNIFTNNPLTEEGFQLGRKLFYDGRLSKDGNFACASCHQQFAAFCTFDHDLSHGFNNSFTTRNAPPLFNLAWMKQMQWDGGISHIEVQPLSPMTAPNEMAENLDSVIKKLRADTSYKRMFKEAFGSSLINSQRMLKALAQFVGSIISADSKYDKVQRGEAKFTLSEQNGYNVFKSKCESCHKEPLFTDNSFRNNGLMVNVSLKDYGRYKITGDTTDLLKFKVPTLRNINLTYPYMHDGRFYTVGQVIEHYRTGIISSPSLDTLLRNKIQMSNADKMNLIMFLGTLTDSTLITNKRYSQPEGCK